MRRNTLGVSWLVVALGAGAWGQAPEPARGLARPERPLALIVANTNYRMNRLVNAVNDARAMEAVLRDLGFSTEVVLDTTKAQMARKIVDFAGRIGEGDTALLYYSGHGVQVSRIYSSLSRPWLPRGEIPCPCAPDLVKADRAAPPAAAR